MKTRRSVAAAAVSTACLLASCTSLENPDEPDDVYDGSYEGGSSDLESVKDEYNADLRVLRSMLKSASRLEASILKMEPVDQYSSAAVSAYNDLVDRYNAVANQYRRAATAFNRKYKAYAEGANGNVPTSPNNIDLPDPIR